MAKVVEATSSPFERAAQAAPVKPISNPNTKKPLGRRPDGTPDWAPVFIEALMSGSTIRRAIRKAGVDITVPYERRKRDEEFRLAWLEACDIGTEFLKQEAQRRAFHGVLKPVWHKGTRVGYERQYSDTLLMFLIKQRDPSFRDGGGEDRSGNFTMNIQVVNVDASRPVVVGQEEHGVGGIQLETVEVANDGARTYIPDAG